jgi:hypothetical protein
MPFKFDMTNPKTAVLGGLAGLVTWKASNFAVDPVHLGMVATAVAAGSATPKPYGSPLQDPEATHSATPYVDNVEEE